MTPEQEQAIYSAYEVLDMHGEPAADQLRDAFPELLREEDGSQPDCLEIHKLATE